MFHTLPVNNMKDAEEGKRSGWPDGYRQSFKIVGVWRYVLEGLWLCYATLQNLIPSFPWIAPGWRLLGAIQGEEWIKFYHVLPSGHPGIGTSLSPLV